MLDIDYLSLSVSIYWIAAVNLQSENHGPSNVCPRSHWPYKRPKFVSWYASGQFWGRNGVTHDIGLYEVSKHGRNGNGAIVGRLGAEGGVRGLDGLPGRVPIRGALMHVDAADADGRTVEVEIDAPEGLCQGLG